MGVSLQPWRLSYQVFLKNKRVLSSDSRLANFWAELDLSIAPDSADANLLRHLQPMH